jgi:hypothetical protein
MMPLATQRQQHLLSSLTEEERRSFYGAVTKLKAAADDWERMPAD